ncbi:MAG: ABC transporter ATP-binding protein [Planctomycetes bacterium GWF2_42_9]|nr:MAG: ABC transporter ATP-binding protein [Planctomycetes bacterium GWF2_42_9]
MAVIGIQDVSIGFGGRPLLENINLQFEAGERICLLGRNGVGKTSFMKLITGSVIPEKGTISFKPKISITCLTQDVPNNLKGTVFELVSEGLGQCGHLLSEYHIVSHQLALDHENQSLLKKLEDLQHEIDSKDAWQMDKYVADIIQNMELDGDVQAENLSAGMKRRALLAQALVRQPDVLLLDEPTNHLDIQTVTWIEEFLQQYKGTLVFVSHDRMFVNKLATRILEFDRGLVTNYSCDYDTFLARRDIANEAREAEEALFDKKLASEEVWIRKGIKARRTRNEGRVRALKSMRQQRKERREQIGNVQIQLQQVQQSGRLVIDAKDISFSYDSNKPLISNFTTTIMRGDRVGIIGPNGCGKTTLLKILLQQIEPQSGSVRQGTNLEIAYFDQLHAELDYGKCVYENIAGGNKTIEINGARRNIVGYLKDFLFTADQCLSPLLNLSGGERNRLLLARLFTLPSNLLIMDEPTNDLDMETLDLLEEVLLDYSGTILIVSHDRQFLNNVVTSIIAMEGDGVVNEYVGGYDDWVRQKKAKDKSVLPENKTVTETKPPEEKIKVRKLSNKEKQELNALPNSIEKMENELHKLHETMADPSFYKKSQTEIAATGAKADELRKLLDNAYARWQQLEALK